MKHFLLFVVATLFFHEISAIPAYPHKIKVKTQHGETLITLWGDENNKFAVTEDGYFIAQDTIGWKYLKTDNNNNLEYSEFTLEDKKDYSVPLKLFLTSSSSVQQITGNKRKLNKPVVKRRSQRRIVGKRKALVVLMEFTDYSFTKTNEEFNALFNEKNYKIDNASGSVYDYYHYVSYGQLELQCDVFGPYVAQHNMSYYGKNYGIGGNDKNPYALFQEALSEVIKHVDLSDYDADKDGFVDNIHIIYAGYGEEAGASSNTIWAHESTFEPITMDGMLIDRYSCAPELRSNRGNGISRIGPHCHEIGHALGAMDYYDTNYTTGGSYEGTGKWDIMASGSWNNDGINPAGFNPYVKAYDFGWCDIVEVNKDTTATLQPSFRSNQIIRLNSPEQGDFFLIENRQQNSFDTSIPGSGLLIYHIGPNMQHASLSNTINASFPQNCYIVCASSNSQKPSSQPSSYGLINSDGCPFPGSSDNTSFTPFTIPAALCINGNSASFSITDIRLGDNGDASFCLTLGSDSIPQGDEEEIPLDGEVVWKEAFSGMFIPQSWTQQFKKGTSQWRKHISFEQGAANYVELYYQTTFGTLGDDYISSCLVSPPIDLQEGSYVLSYDISSEGENTNSDSIIINYRTEDNHSWIRIKADEAHKGYWQTKSTIINHTGNTFSLSFEGVARESSAVRLSNIYIRNLPQQPTQLSISESNLIESQIPPHPYAFNISGYQTRSIFKGLNIIRMKDGSYKKICK